jgi:hypothetical protein
MASGLRWQWRKRGYRGWIAFNAGSTGIATLAAASCYIALPDAWIERRPDRLGCGDDRGCRRARLLLPVIIGFSFVVEGQGLTVREWLGDIRSGNCPVASVCSRRHAARGGCTWRWARPSCVLIIVPIVIGAREMFASYMRVKESHEETVGLLIHALEQKRSLQTAGHAGRVANYARYIGEELNFMPARLEASGGSPR